jgi:4-hydroxy-3-methylbut-2-enyl diphosphate reductase
VPAYLIDDAEALQPAWFGCISSAGLTAGASAPEILVQGVIERLRRFAALEISVLDGVREDVVFRLPPDLSDTAMLAAD